jgi:hypothetical protein
MPEDSREDSAQLRRWVETWRRAGERLAQIRRAEIESIDTRQAVEQIFASDKLPISVPALPTSGLVEQQAWFARLRSTRGR